MGNVLRESALSPAIRKQQEQAFKNRSVPRFWSQHGQKVAESVETTLCQHKSRLQLSGDDITSLTLMALYHPLPSLHGVNPQVISLISDSFVRFDEYRKLDEKDLPKDIKAYQRMMFPSSGRMDPVFLVRAIDNCQSEELSAEKVEDLYRYLGEIVDGARIRKNICYSMLEVYYPIFDALHFVDSDQMRDIAVGEIWGTEMQTISNALITNKKEIERGQSAIRELLSDALSKLAHDRSIVMIGNDSGSLVYTDRVKDAGSAVPKLIRKNLPMDLDSVNDLHGFLAITDNMSSARRLADRLHDLLERMLQSKVSLDQRYLAQPKEDGTVHPSIAIDMAAPIISRTGAMLSSFGAEVQILPSDAVRECTRGSIIHGRYKQIDGKKPQFSEFDEEQIMDPETLQNLMTYLGQVYGETSDLSQLKPPNTEVEHVKVRCSITDGETKTERTLILDDDATLLDVLSRLDLLQKATFTTTMEAGARKPVRYGDEIRSGSLEINVLGPGGIDASNARFFLIMTSDPETIRALLQIKKRNGNGNGHNGKRH